MPLRGRATVYLNLLLFTPCTEREMSILPITLRQQQEDTNPVQSEFAFLQEGLDIPAYLECQPRSQLKLTHTTRPSNLAKELGGKRRVRRRKTYHVEYVCTFQAHLKNGAIIEAEAAKDTHIDISVAWAFQVRSRDCSVSSTRPNATRAIGRECSRIEPCIGYLAARSMRIKFCYLALDKVGAVSVVAIEVIIRSRCES